MAPKHYILASSCALLLVNPVAAQDLFNWSGTGANGNWSTAGNWQGGVVPNANAILNFDGLLNTNTTNDLTSYQGHRIIFQTGAGAFTLGGNAVSLFDVGTAAPRIENLSSSTQRINLNLTLDGSTAAGGVAEIHAQGGSLIFNGTVTLADPGNTHLQISGANQASVVFNNALSGDNQVTVSGNVAVELNAANSYSGNTVLNGGVVRLGNGNALGATTAGTTVNDGATLDLNGQSVGAESITIAGAGNGGVGALINDSGTAATLAGAVALSGASSIGGGGNLTLSAGLEGAGHTLTKTGAGTVTLAAAATRTGETRLTGGMLSISNYNQISSDAARVVFDGGTLQITATATSARPFTFESGSNRVVTTAGTTTWSGQLSGPGGFVKSGAGTLALQGSTANTNEGLIEVQQGTLRLQNTSGNAIGAGGVRIASNTNSAATVLLGADNQIDDNAPITLDANGGQTALLDLNNFTETVGPVTLSSTTFGGAVIRTGMNGRLILNGDLTMNNNRNATGNTGREVLITATGNSTTGIGIGGTLDLGGGDRRITVNTNNTQANNHATIETVITNGRLIKDGAGVLRLSAANTYTGGTVINRGTLMLNAAEALPANTSLTISAPTAGTSATLNLNGTDLTLVPAHNLVFGGGAGSSHIATGAGTLFLTQDFVFDATNNPQTSTITGQIDLGGNRVFNVPDSTATASELQIGAVIVSNGNLTKVGTGALSLRAQSPDWKGDIIVNEGTLRFDTGLSNNTQFANVFGAASNELFVNDATLQFHYHTTASAERTVTGRLINVGAGGATIDVQGTYNNFVEGVFSQIRLNGTGNSTILRGNGSLTKTGGGRLQLQTASPEFSGAVVVEDGTFETAGSALGDASATNTITINGGNLALSGDIFQPLVTLNGGALSTTGASRTLHGKVNVAGDSRVFLNNFWTDASSGWNMTLNGEVSGSANLLVGVNRSGYDNNTGSLILRNTSSTYSGTITVQKGLGLTNESSTGVGKTIGNASVELAGGRLTLRDNGTGSDGTLAYGNNLTVNEPAGGGDQAGTSTIDVDRAATGTSQGNTFRLGTLTVNSQAFNVVGSNRYGVEFAGLTTFNTSPTINVSGGTLSLSGGLSAAGQTFTKTGIGTLRILGPADFTSYTLTQGTLELAAAPAGTGREIALPLGTGFSAGYVATQANLIDRITFDSAGVVGLGVDSTFNPNFTGFTNGLRLGGSANATLTGTITPADNTVRLGGGGGTLTLASTNAVSGAVNLDVNTSGTAPGVVFLASSNNFTGTVSVGGGMTLRIQSLNSLGTNAAPVSLDSGTLQLAAGGTFASPSPLLITAAAGGATLDTSGHNLELTNGIQGTGSFTKAGEGNLTLTAANATFGGSLILGGGSVTIGADTHLGAVPGSTVANRLQFDGGKLIATADLTIPVARGVTFTPAGGVIDTGANTVTIASVMAGAGTSLTKEGAGTLVLTANNTYTGLTTINAGTLEVTNNIESDVVINSGGTLLTTGTNSIQDGRNLTLNAGGIYDIRASDTIGFLQGNGLVTRGIAGTTTLQINSATSTTFGGLFENGAGTLAITKGGAGILTLTGTNTQTGSTTIFTGQIRVEGPNGRLSGGGTIFVGDNNGNDESLVLGNHADVVTGAFDRIANNSELEFRGTVPVTINGPAAGSAEFTESMGNLDFREGAGILTLVPAPGGQVVLNPTSFNRQFANGSGVIRGTNLGGTGANSSRVIFNTAPEVVGSNGTGSLASIVPFVMGGTSVTSAPNTFLRYDATNGLVPLGDSDYEATLAGSTGRNVSLAGNETLASNAGVNAIRVTGGTTSIGAGSTLRLDSGAILFTGSGSIGGTGNIDVGNRQIVLHAAGDGTSLTGEVSANLIGANGLIVGDAGDVIHTILLSGNNTFVGGVTVNNGILQLGSAGALNPVFLSDLALRGGNSSTTTATSTVLRLGGNDASVLFAGADRLQGSTRIENGSAAPATLRVFTNVTSDGNDGVMQNGGGGGALSFVKGGAAQLTLEQNNTYTGTTQILDGNLRLRGASGALSGTSEIQINGGTLTVRNEGSGNVNANRIPDAAPILLRSGDFNFESTSDSGQSYSENAGPLRLLGGMNIVRATQAASGRTSNVQFDSLERMNPGTIVDFSGTSLGASGRNRISFDTAPVLTNGIIGGWAFQGVDFASYSDDVDAATGDQPSIVPAIYDSNATNASQTAWTATSNIRPSESITLTANRTVYSVNLPNNVDANLGGFTLVSDSGGMIVSGDTLKTISNGTLTAGTTANSELILHAASSTSSATVDAVIADNSAGAVSFIKSGDGKVTLAKDNTYTGGTALLDGTLSITTDTQLGAVPSAPAAGNLRLDGGTLEIAGLVSLNENRGIMLGVADSAIDVRASGVFMFDGAIQSQGAGSLAITAERTTTGSAVSTAYASMNLSEALDMDGAFRFNASGSVLLIGSNNRVGGTLQVGTDQADATLNYNVAGGSLSVGGVNANLSDLHIGYRPATSGNTSTATRGTVDLTGSDNFTATVNNVLLGVITGAGGSGAAEGRLVIGNDSSITALTQIVLSDSPNSGNNTTNGSSIAFGSGQNRVVTPLFTIGGRKGTGSVTIAPGGTLDLSGFASGSSDLFVARNNIGGTGTTAQGTMDLRGGTFIADLDELVIGHKSGTGGSNGGANGTLSVDGTGNRITANSVRIGERLGDGQNNTTGVINFGGGTMTVKGDLGIGLALGTATTGTMVRGTLNVFDGDIAVGGNVELAMRPTAGNAEGTISLYGGSLTVGGNLTTTNDPAATSMVSIEGGTLDMTGGSINSHFFFTSSGGLNNVGQIFQGDGTTPAPLTKSSFGTLTVGGTNNYTGATDVASGTLLVSGSLSGTSAVNVATGATFGGTGTVNPAATLTLEAGATLAPGLSTGTLSTGNVVFKGGTLALEIMSPTAFDQLLVNGSVKLDASVALSITLGATFPMGQTFTILSNDGTDALQLAGGALFTFNGVGLAEGDLLIVPGSAGAQGFTISYQGGSGNDVVLTAVPEPGSAAVLLGAVCSLLGVRRFRRRS